MYRVSKRMEIAGAHKLSLTYSSRCQNLHGHGWIVVVYCQSEELDENGMVVDFSFIKSLIHDKLDHHYINDVVNCNPTAENIAKWICDQVPNCYKVTVQESEGNMAEYEI